MKLKIQKSDSMTNTFMIFLSAVIIMTVAGCNKVPPPRRITCESKPYPSAPPVGKPPMVFAGPDVTVGKSLGMLYLAGTYLDAIDQYAITQWKKIEGPECQIENPGSLATSVLNVMTGVYQFELSVSNRLGLSAKDTIKVIVDDTIERSITLMDLKTISNNSGVVIPITLQIDPAIVNNVDYVLVRYNYPDGDVSTWRIANFEIPPVVNWDFDLGFWYKKISGNQVRINGSLYDTGSFDIKIYY